MIAKLRSENGAIKLSTRRAALRRFSSAWHADTRLRLYAETWEYPPRPFIDGRSRTRTLRETSRARDFGDQVLEDEAVDISDTMEEASETIDSFSEKHGASSTVKKGDAVAHRRLRAEVRLKVVARRKGAKIQLDTNGAGGEGLASVYEKIREVAKGKK